ncbi:MAG: cellulase family glycosylhydrolase, partial [Anaerolineae bacterium]|nr:cellulase family glycosylhydrolase [Anaerolineae bacterium]
MPSATYLRIVTISCFLAGSLAVWGLLTGSGRIAGEVILAAPAPEEESPARRAPIPAPAAVAAPTSLTAGDFMGVWLIPSQDWGALPALRSAGAKWARIAISWANTEPVPGAGYNWTAADNRLRDLRNQGYEIILALMHAPSWAADYECGPIRPEALPAFAEFAAAVTSRYSVSPYNVRYLELGNEPDNGDVVNHAWVGGCWGIGPNPAPGAGGDAYARMLQAVYPAVKAVNPNMQVALGGLSYEAWTTEGGPYDPNFLRDLLAAGGGDYFDILNYHFYEAFSYKWGSVVGKGQQMQALVRSYTGRNKALMVTEFSTPSSKPPGGGDPNEYSEELQARYVMKGLTQGIGAGIFPMVWFQAVDRPENSGGYAYGLIRSNGSLKPAYYAYRTFAQELGTWRYEQRLTGLDARIEGHAFNKIGKLKYIVWTNGPDVNQAFALAAAGNGLRVVSKEGNARVIVDGGTDDLDNARNGAVTLTVGHSPLILEPDYSSGA